MRSLAGDRIRLHRAVDRFALARRGRALACSSKQVAIQSSAQAMSVSVSQDRQAGRSRAGASSADVVVPAAAGIDRGPHRAALVEGADRGPGIAQRLHGDRAEQRRFAGAGRAEDQRVADVADMQVDPERGRAGGRGVQQRRGARRVEGAGVGARLSLRGAMRRREFIM